MNLPKRKISVTIKREVGIKIPILGATAKQIPKGFELMQPNKLFDAPPDNAFHYWRDLETGKFACQILRKISC